MCGRYQGTLFRRRTCHLILSVVGARCGCLLRDHGHVSVQLHLHSHCQSSLNRRLSERRTWRYYVEACYDPVLQAEWRDKRWRVSRWMSMGFRILYETTTKSVEKLVTTWQLHHESWRKFFGTTLETSRRHSDTRGHVSDWDTDKNVMNEMFRVKTQAGMHTTLSWSQWSLHSLWPYRLLTYHWQWMTIRINVLFRMRHRLKPFGDSTTWLTGRSAVTLSKNVILEMESAIWRSVSEGDET